ncbi:MAG: hypothetical protein IZT60_10060, partial [Gammaproteobacteria bacterium]|nr:hypothetical protein [Gammaproteobacteria bacterium]
TFQIELFTQSHYKQSIEPDENLSELYKDLFLFHWKEESTHALMDEIEWPREDKKLTAGERDRSVDELIELVVAVDGILQNQCADDVGYFLKNCNRSFDESELTQIRESVLAAYRWQYIFSGVQHKRFGVLLGNLTTEAQQKRINNAMETLM